LGSGVAFMHLSSEDPPLCVLRSAPLAQSEACHLEPGELGVVFADNLIEPFTLDQLQAAIELALHAQSA
jgi:hypothetical protein